MDTQTLAVVLVVLALSFDFINGFHDSANVVATMISSRAMSPRAALTIAALAEFTGPLLFGVAVATTIGKDVVDPSAISIQVVLAALVGASLWNLLTWFLGIPSSSSHALIGGLVGAVAFNAGWEAIQVNGMIKIVAALLVSPLAGFLVGALFMRVVLWAARGASPRASRSFKLAQIPTAVLLALSHGANDAQKTMGVITLGLVVLGYQSSFHVPLWVIVSSAGALALGTAVGGWRIIRTLGVKFFRIRPVHGFTSQLTSATVILTASLVGGPVSTTQVVSSAIMGVGAGQRASQVRWGVLREILTAWVLTIPATIGLGMLFAWLANQIIR